MCDAHYSRTYRPVEMCPWKHVLFLLGPFWDPKRVVWGRVWGGREGDKSGALWLQFVRPKLTNLCLRWCKNPTTDDITSQIFFVFIRTDYLRPDSGIVKNTPVTWPTKLQWCFCLAGWCWTCHLSVTYSSKFLNEKLNEKQKEYKKSLTFLIEAFIKYNEMHY
jgi:hypothetical protein